MRAVAILALACGVAGADPTSGVDADLFRSSYDANGGFAVEGARPMPRHDISFKATVDYAHAPITAPVPGVGSRILGDLATFDMVVGVQLGDRIAVGLDAGFYRTSLGSGYGVRGRYANGAVAVPSTGLESLRPLSNIDPGGPLSDELAGPLDLRLGLKYALVLHGNLSVTAIGSVSLPFGDEEMLLGDRSLVFEPKLAAELRGEYLSFLVNAGARIRERAVLEAYDPMTQQPGDAKAFLDVGSEAVVGGAAIFQPDRELRLVAEAQAFVPLPSSLSYGDCRLFSGAPCDMAQYAPGAKKGDLAALVTAGAMIDVASEVTMQIVVGHGFGARGDQLLVTTGLTWSPRPGTTTSRGDRDGDGIPDSSDACPDEAEDKDGYQDEDGCPDPDNDGDGIPDAHDRCPLDAEDKDGYQDEDGCPEPDNDNDGIPDIADKCPNEPEDKDGFQDEDGCPDLDNDNDGIPDSKDKCPNDAETVNGFQDEDGCPDVQQPTGPVEKPDRIDLQGATVTFDKAALTPGAKALLDQVATLIKTKKLAIRIEVHVARHNKTADKALSTKRAQAVLDYLISKGVPQQQVQAVGIGSERPLGTSKPEDAINDRVDFIKAQRSTP